ncbi:hypothetical protein [Streptomyces atroolivaceus]|uniref:hypothetical protein n=1 Tax=Streptomyces atroolivaceus TaxID=66869 RepID=UPI0037B4F28F
MIARKHEELDDPDVVELYGLLSGALDWPPNDPRIAEVADIMERLTIRAVEAGEVGADDGVGDQFVDLLDSTMVESSPVAARLLAIPEERGWRGWIRIERVAADRINTELPPS